MLEDTPQVDLSNNVALAYAKSLHLHLEYVYEAGLQLRVPLNLLFCHDSSKWDLEEFIPYANHFHGVDDPDAFSKAWLRHIHMNPHHWNHWVIPDGNKPCVDCTLLEMPKIYVREMIADWMGASRAYTGSWDMTEWLVSNAPGIRLHPKTKELLSHILTGLAYNMDTIHFRTN